MLQIVIGLSIVLAIVILTVFILTIQHVSFANIFGNNKYKDEEEVITKTKTNDEKGDKQEVKQNESSDSKTNDSVVTEETAATQMLEEGKSVDEILTELKTKNVEDQTCCFVNKFVKQNGEWLGGVERRCNEFAEKSCEESLYSCDTVLDKKECDDNELCEFDEDSNKCKNIPNAHEGSELDCATFERFKRINFPNTQFNCQNDLII
jgi:hypothetical protein